MTYNFRTIDVETLDLTSINDNNLLKLVYLEEKGKEEGIKEGEKIKP